MKLIRIVAIGFLAVVILLSLGADFFGRYDATAQFRDHPNEAPSRNFPLGTDELGRDRFSRLLHGSRLRAPTIIEITASRPGYITRVARFHIHDGTGPTLQIRCTNAGVTAGSRRLGPCPRSG